MVSSLGTLAQMARDNLMMADQFFLCDNTEINEVQSEK